MRGLGWCTTRALSWPLDNLPSAPSDTGALSAVQAAQHKEAEAVLQQRDRYITRLEGRLLATRRASAPCRSVIEGPL